MATGLALLNLPDELQCHACKISFTSSSNLARHCQNRPGDSNCHLWYNQIYLPNLYYQGVSIHARLQHGLDNTGKSNFNQQT